VIETPTFQRQAREVWTDEERESFIDWIASNPEAGDVIPGADGARKVRWAVAGRGKRGGARVIYFHLSQQGAVLLAMVYVKADRSSVSRRSIKKAV
jgi:mRNA-degrading endonuclease RelE of RelBE toxin-antitoxin system